MWLETIPQSPDHADKCPTCGGCVQRRAYGEMYAGSFISDGRRVEIRKRPAEGFSDPVYLDPLNQYFDGGLYRLWPSEKYYARGGKRLHRDVWVHAFGVIPGGSHIHHRDGNTANNNIANLECLPANEHLSDAWHARRGGLSVEHFSELARSRATEWHKSEEGRLWHRRNAMRTQSWTKWKRETKPCEFCQKPFDALVRKNGHTSKYCSPNCKSASYRARNASG